MATPSIKLPLVAWSALATIAALLLLNAIGENPWQYYNHLRWIVLLTAGTGVVIAWHVECFGWAIVMIAGAVLYNPFDPFRFARSTWTPINVVTAVLLLIFAATFVGKDLRRRSTHIRGFLDSSLLVIIGAAWAALLLQAGAGLAILIVSYLAVGDERLADTWYLFRAEYSLVITLISFVVALASLAVAALRRGQSQQRAAPPTKDETTVE